MPSPQRAVRRSLSHLERTGLPRQRALAIIGDVLASMRARLLAEGQADVPWLDKADLVLDGLTRAHQNRPATRRRGKHGHTTAASWWRIVAHHRGHRQAVIH